MSSYHLSWVAAVILFASCLTVAVPLGGGRDSITLTGNGSYVAYPQWTLFPNAQTTITFLTSEASGTLAFVNTVAGFVHVRLQAGTLSVVAAAAAQPVILGQHLNDNAPHDLQISSRDDGCLLSIRLTDSNLSAAANLACTPSTSYELRSLLYVGGAPGNYSSPSSSIVPFAGCLLDIVTSLSNGTGVRPPPVSSEGATLGCRTPCDDDPCARNASCTYRWGAQTSTTCDCRDVILVGAGPTCSDGEEVWCACVHGSIILWDIFSC